MEVVAETSTIWQSLQTFWQSLQTLDEQLFLLVNRTWVHPWADQFFVFLTNMHKMAWVKWGLLPLVLALWFYFQGRNTYKVVLVLALTVAMTDTLGYRVFKEHIDRPRPNNTAHLDGVLRLPHSPQSGSFPSNHALNTFTGAMILSWYYPGLWPVYFSIAALTAYSRVYVGVHYPSDVVAGALMGLLIVVLLHRILLRHLTWIHPEIRRSRKGTYVVDRPRWLDFR